MAYREAQVQHTWTRDVLLRQARWRDCLKVLRWRNEVTNRKQMIDTEKVSLLGHLRWYRYAMKRKDVRVFIVLYRGVEVGSCRYDLSGDHGTAAVSVTLAQWARGKHLGRQAIMLLSDAIKLEAGPDVVARALIRADNVASLRAFEAAGYKHEREVLGCRLMERR